MSNHPNQKTPATHLLANAPAFGLFSIKKQINFMLVTFIYPNNNNNNIDAIKNLTNLPHTFVLIISLCLFETNVILCYFHFGHILYMCISASLCFQRRTSLFACFFFKLFIRMLTNLHFMIKINTKVNELYSQNSQEIRISSNFVHIENGSFASV